MKKSYRHLTEKDRTFLRVMLERRYSKNKIAEILGVHRLNNRPSVINQREEFGHWEGDLMMFKQGIKGNLITLRELRFKFEMQL